MRLRPDVTAAWLKSSLRPTSQLRGASQQIHFLSVAGGEHLDQQLVGGIARERIPRFENRFVDRAEARLELGDGLGSERCFLLIEQVLKQARRAQVIVLLDREGGESGRRRLS